MVHYFQRENEGTEVNLFVKDHTATTATIGAVSSGVEYFTSIQEVLGSIPSSGKPNTTKTTQLS